MIRYSLFYLGPFIKEIFDRNSILLSALQLIEYGGDREAFAKHAKRSTVQADEVKLLVRRNKGLTTTSTRAG